MAYSFGQEVRVIRVSEERIANPVVRSRYRGYVGQTGEFIMEDSKGEKVWLKMPDTRIYDFLFDEVEPVQK